MVEQCNHTVTMWVSVISFLVAEILKADYLNTSLNFYAYTRYHLKHFIVEKCHSLEGPGSRNHI